MTQLKLRPVNHAKGDTNRYCGPSAISAVTGMTSGEAARLLRSVTGRTAIKGASSASVCSALARCGVCVERVEHRARVFTADFWRFEAYPTLAAWLKATHGTRGGKVLLVSAGHHWQVVSGNRFVCGQTRDVVALDHPKVHRHAEVKAVYWLDAPHGVTIPTEARKPKAKVANRARALARKVGAVIEIHPDRGPDFRYYVYHPALEDSPLDWRACDHYVDCWEEVLERVKEYEAYFA